MIVLGVGVCGASGALLGCVSDRNARPVLGSNVVIGGGVSRGVTGDAVSVRGLDRSNWGATDVRVPVDGTVHRPTYARARLYDETLARQKGLYPTSETALELEGSRWMSAAEIAAQPLRTLVDAAALPLLVAMDPPWNARQSPDAVYKRRAPGGWLTGGGAVPAGMDHEPAGTPPVTGGAPALEPVVEEVAPDA